MSDDHSALVALSERQIKLLLWLIEHRGEALLLSVWGDERKKAQQQLQIALYAIEQEKQRGY